MRAGIFLTAIAALSGCSSFRTQAIDRMENDTLVVNPSCPLKGVPVSLRIPTHLELVVVERTFWERKDVPGQKPDLVPVSSCRPTRTVRYTVNETEKIFLVDPMRPGAGTEKYGLTFQSSDDKKKDETSGKGYLKNVTYNVDDKTITESANLLAKSLGFINAIQTSAAPDPTTANLVETERVIAFTRLDINSPSFEYDVDGFLDTHINNVCPSSSPPTVCTHKGAEQAPMPVEDKSPHNPGRAY